MSLTHSPIPSRPIANRTFAVAVIVLGLFALVQVLAVLGRYLPTLRNQLVASATADAPPTATIPAAVSEAAALPPAAAQSRQAAVPSATLQEASRLLSEARSRFRVGEFDAALELLDQLEVLVPGDPAALVLRVEILVTAGQTAEAVLALEQLMKVPGLPPDARAAAQRRLDQLAEALSSGAVAQPMPLPQRDSTATASRAEEGLAIRDDVGLQPGAMLGIVSAKLMEGAPGKQTLRVALKARPGQAVNTEDMKVRVFFYEQDENGDILPTSSSVTWQWISQPVDWSEGEPEILDLGYTLPDSNLPGSATSDGSPGRRFFGYVVGVYYNNELQDSRAEPGALGKEFELPLYLKSEEQ